MYQPMYNLENIISNYVSNNFNSFSYSVQSYILPSNNHVKDLNYFSFNIKSYTDNENLIYERNRHLDVVYMEDLSVFVRYSPIIEFKDMEIEDAARNIFTLVTGKRINDGVKMNICSLEEFGKVQSLFGVSGGNVQGFCINKDNVIFVKKTDIANTLVVLGHELGHIFTRELKSKHDEEAKAFAFCIEWVKKIKEKNILNLKDSLTLNIRPATNGLHNLAFEFILNNLAKGKSAMEIYWELVYGILSFYN